eukprot:gene13112-17576_t
MRNDCIRTLNGHNGAVNKIRFTADGTYCMTVGDDKKVCLWNPHKDDPSSVVVTSETVGTNGLLLHSQKTPKNSLLIKQYTGNHGYSILDVAISTDKSKFASCGMDKTIFMFDVISSQIIRKIQGHATKVNSIVLNEESTLLFSASYDQSVKIWDLRGSSFNPVQVLSDFKDSVTSVSITSDSILASSVDGKVRIYDLRKGQLSIDDMIDPITHISINNNMESYLSNCMGSVTSANNTNGAIYLMDMRDGQLLKQYGGHLQVNFKVESCFSSDGQEILCGDENGSIFQWDLLTSQIKNQTKYAHSKGISSIAYHPTNPIFLTSSYDGTVKCWENKANDG